LKLSELIGKLENIQDEINQDDDVFNTETGKWKNDPEVKVFIDEDEIYVVDDLFHDPKRNEVILDVE
jgi:hypothetical protein